MTNSPQQRRDKTFKGMIPLFMSAICIGVMANTPPVIALGPDTSYSIQPSSSFFLLAEVSDDGQLFAEPELAWSVLGGPDTGCINSPKSQFTSVDFDSPGVYTFRLQAYDGQFTSSDTMLVTVSRSVLRILKPSSGEVLAAGQPYTITWDMNSPVGMVIYFSDNNGLSWTEIVDQAVGVSPPMQWTWSVPQTGRKDSCMIRVAYYQDRATFALSGYFSISGTGIRRQVSKHQALRPNRIKANSAFTASGRLIDEKVNTREVPLPGIMIGKNR